MVSNSSTCKAVMEQCDFLVILAVNDSLFCAGLKISSMLIYCEEIFLYFGIWLIKETSLRIFLSHQVQLEGLH